MVRHAYTLKYDHEGLRPMEGLFIPAPFVLLVRVYRKDR